MSTETLCILLPEIVLIAAAAAIYVVGAFIEAQGPWRWVAGGAILLAATALAGQHTTLASSGPLLVDPLAQYSRWLALGLGTLLVLSATRPLGSLGAAEYVGSLLLTIVGLMLAAASGDLVLLFVGLELISIPTYILLYLGRRDAASQEATLKYFFLSVLASAMLLYGFSFLYGMAGSTQLAAIRAAVAAPEGLHGLGGLVKIAMILLFAGLGFKIAAVPFHFYAPDVYQGTTHLNAALLSVVPKAAGLVVLARIMLPSLGSSPLADSYLWRIALGLSVLTMTFGNVVALWQDNLRRLLAYSSIAHAGYMLIGLSAGLAGSGTAATWDGPSGLLFYLCVYAAATVGAFAVAAYLGRDQQQLDAIDELAGLGRTHPRVAALMALFMFSLAGLPPLAGFWGKLLLFGSALNVDSAATGDASRHLWFMALAIIGVLNAAVAAAYYLRIVAIMYFRAPLATRKPQGGAGPWCAAVACGVLVLVLSLWPGPLMQQSNHASPTADTNGQRIVGATQDAEGAKARNVGVSG
jgi:NADH-quinone oxidoreductase subunit N